MSIFPFMQPATVEKRAGMPLYREIEWDYENNKPVFSAGRPVFISGGPAVAVWAFKALHSQRYLYEIYSNAYGNELDALIGRPYTHSVKAAEAARYVRECLLINPYIRSVNNIVVSFSKGRLTISCELETIYGKEPVNVRKTNG